MLCFPRAFIMERREEEMKEKREGGTGKKRKDGRKSANH